MVLTVFSFQNGHEVDAVQNGLFFRLIDSGNREQSGVEVRTEGRGADLLGGKALGPIQYGRYAQAPFVNASLFGPSAGRLGDQASVVAAV